MLDKLRNELNLGEYEITQLSDFDEVVLQESYKIYKQTPMVVHPFKFILSCCRNVKEKIQRTKPRQTTRGTTEPKAQFRDADLGIIPSIDLTFDENVQRWLTYEEKAKLDWAEQSDFHRRLLASRKVRFMWDLDRHTPENLERWRKYAAELREKYPYENGGVAKFVESLGIKPESAILNETPLEQPKTQEEKKDSTMTNVVRIKKHEHGLTIDYDNGSYSLMPKDHKHYETYLAMYYSQPEILDFSFL
jgi:hypothetical protein